MSVMKTGIWTIDYIEAGSGPCVILLHSSAAGNRQWRTTTERLQKQYHVIAVNFFGYGETSHWPGDREQTLGDQSNLVEPFVDQAHGDVTLVGHSFGGAVAMYVASRYPDKVSRLILLEPIPFRLLDASGQTDAYAEIVQLRNTVKRYGRWGDWEGAASCFADYWNGEGTWDAMSPERRQNFASLMRSTSHEWDAVLGRSAQQDWRKIDASTLVVSTRDTKRPIQQIVQVLRERVPHWEYQELSRGGHMFPLTEPEITNRLISAFLRDGSTGRAVVSCEFSAYP